MITTIASLKPIAKTTPGIYESAHVQITDRHDGTTESGRCYIDLTLADAGGSEKVRIWENSAAYELLTAFPAMAKGTAVEITAGWKTNQWGLQAEKPRLRALSPDEMNALFEGGQAFQKSNEEDWNYVTDIFARMADNANPFSPLGQVCVRLLDLEQKQFRRAAAAHAVHHARRGGLLAHTASMLRVAVALCEPRCNYPEVTAEILYAGVLLHDFGKVMETDYQEFGFALDPSLRGVLVGHISIGYAVFMQMWMLLHGGEESLLRDHVAHVILAHHGQKEWGSPVEPITPEAILAHEIDMMDAGIEKLRNAWTAAEPGCAGAVRGVYPIKGDVPLPYKSSAAYVRHRIAVALWWWRKALNAKTDAQFASPAETENRFVKALVAEGIIAEVKPLKDLPRTALEAALERWGTLRMHCEGLPALP